MHERRRPAIVSVLFPAAIAHLAQRAVQRLATTGTAGAGGSARLIDGRGPKTVRLRVERFAELR